MKAAIIAIVAVIVIAGGVFAFTKKGDSKKTEPPQTTSQSTIENTQPAPTDTNTKPDETTVITYSDAGFSPASITVKSGLTVLIKNSTSHTLQFDSDPHPAHTDNRELNVDTIRAGESKSFMVSKSGRFGYHNHLNPSETGTIVVE